MRLFSFFSSLALGFALIVLTSCQGVGSGSSGGGNAPTATLSANPTSITLGQTAALNWTTTNANTVTIDNGIGAQAAT